MANTCLLSDQSKHYLCCYYQILDEMIQAITTAKLTQSISHNSIVQLLPHSRAAVRLSRNILGVSEHRGLRRLAQDILDRQTQAVGELEEALAACGQDAAPQMDLRLCQRRMELIFREMFAQMNSAPEGNRLDVLFLRQMIPHRQGAVRMAQNALRYGVDPELEPILRSTADIQRWEIGQMNSLLRRMSCQGT